MSGGTIFLLIWILSVGALLLINHSTAKENRRHERLLEERARLDEWRPWEPMPEEQRVEHVKAAAAGEHALYQRRSDPAKIRTENAPFAGFLRVVESTESIYFEIEGLEPGQYARTPDVPVAILKTEHETIRVGWSS